MARRRYLWTRLVSELFHEDRVLVEALRHRIRVESPPGQARVALALLADGPEFQPPERPVTYGNIAEAFGISTSTVATQLRRIRRKDPDLWTLIDAERQRRLETWRMAAAADRRERARRWGKRQWAARYRQLHGQWPWNDPGHTGR